MSKPNETARVTLGTMGNWSERNPYPITTYAARTEGIDGWLIGQDVVELSEIEIRLRTSNHSLVEIRAVSRGLGFTRNADGTPKLDENFGWIALHHGWAFDNIASVWRAPGEPLLAPSGVPTLVEDIEIKFGSPDAGWLPISIAAGTQSFTFDASHVYDPFPELLSWLESLVGGKHPRLTINIEGAYVDFLTYPGSDEASIRFLAAVSGNAGNRKIHIDVAIPRRAFVGSICGGLRAFAASPAYLRDEWCAQPLSETLAKSIPSLRVEHLADFDARFVEGLLWAVAPRFEADIATFDPSDQGVRIAELRDIDNRPLPAIYRPAVDFHIPPEFDDWDRERRRGFLDNLLRERHNSWLAVDLLTLRSATIEKWSANSDAPIAQ